ncbi:MAG: hypothetical protein KGL39_34500, partial [Patescibacteria group bacterium]|nr:hypothetical protein [Patescibacteria group bacterium]
MLNWTVTHQDTETAYRTHWTSPCGQWRVTLSVYYLGHTDQYADRYRALHLTPDGWRRVGPEHFRQSAAFRTLEKWIARTAREARRAAREQERLAKKAERRKERRNRMARRTRAARKRTRQLTFA